MKLNPRTNALMERWIYRWKRMGGVFDDQDEINRRAREEEERYQITRHIVNGMKIEAKE